MAANIIIVIGYPFIQRKAAIETLIRSGIDKRNIFDSGNDPIKIKGFRNQFYFDVGYNANYQCDSYNNYERIKVEMIINEHAEYKLEEN